MLCGESTCCSEGGNTKMKHSSSEHVVMDVMNMFEVSTVEVKFVVIKAVKSHC